MDPVVIEGTYLAGICCDAESPNGAELVGVGGAKAPVKEPRKLDDAPATSESNMDARFDVFVILQ